MLIRHGHHARCNIILDLVEYIIAITLKSLDVTITG